MEGCSETEIIKFQKAGCLQAQFGLGAASGPRDFKSHVSADLHLSGNRIPAGTHFFKCVYRPLFTHAPHIRKSEACPVQ